MATSRDYSALAEQTIAAHRPLLELEFHPAAVAALDAFIDLTWGEAGAAPADDRWQPSRGQGAAILGFGAFLGEMIRRERGGEWRDDPAQPGNVLAARVVLPDGSQVLPISKAYRRLKDGGEDRLEPLYLHLRSPRSGAAPGEIDGWIRQARHFARVGRPDLAARFCERALALSPAAEKRAEIEGLRAAWAAATRTAEDEDRGRVVAETRAKLAALADEGRRALADFGVRVEHGALTLCGLDSFLDEVFGRGPVAPAKRRPPLELALGAFVGELLCARYGGRWMDETVGPIERSRVAWPSGLASCPFEILDRRLGRGGPSALEQAAKLIKALCAQGDATDPPEDPVEWFAQADAFVQKPGRLALAVQSGTAALGFAGGDTGPRRLKLAAWCRALGRVEAARQHLDAGLRREPTSAALRLESARVALARGDTAAAEAEAGLALERRPESAEAHLLRAAALAARGLHEPALAAFEQALGLDPANAVGLLGKARTLLELGRPAECRDWMDRLVGRVDCEPERSYVVGLAADATGDTVAACERFERVKDDAGLAPERRARAAARARDLAADPAVRAAAAERLPELEAAVAAYARLSADAPRLAEPWRERGVGLSMLGRPDEALACLRRAAQLEPGDPTSYDHEGVVLARLGRLDEAIAALERGLRSCPSAGALLWRKGVFLSMKGANEEALMACDAALAADPEDVEAWAFKGDIESKLGRQADAIASLQRYLAARTGSREKRVEAARRQLWSLRHPGRARDEARARERGARALERAVAGALAEALRLFDEAVEADPLLDDVWFNRGTCLQQLSRFEEALASFARTEDLAGPSSHTADSSADCLYALGRGAEVVAAYDRLLAKQPGSPEGLRGRARALVRLGRAAEAVPLYARLVARSPQDLALARERVDALRRAHRHLEALAACEALLVSFPDDSELKAGRADALRALGREAEAAPPA